METLKCNERTKSTVHAAKKSRKAGRIPGVLYGEKLNNILFEIGEIELSKEIAKGGEHGVLNIDINGTEHKTLIKEVQRDPVNHKVMHIDLEDIYSDKMIQSDVPLIFMGEDNVIRNGGILQKERDSVKVHCKASELPKYINVDLGGLRYGQAYKVRDIEVAGEIFFMDDPSTVIATVTGDNTKVVIPESSDTPYPNETKIHNPA